MRSEIKKNFTKNKEAIDYEPRRASVDSFKSYDSKGVQKGQKEELLKKESPISFGYSTDIESLYNNEKNKTDNFSKEFEKNIKQNTMNTRYLCEKEKTLDNIFQVNINIPNKYIR